MQDKRLVLRHSLAAALQGFCLMLAFGPILLGLALRISAGRPEVYAWLLGLLAYPVFGASLRVLISRPKRWVPQTGGWLLALLWGLGLHGLNMAGILSAVIGFVLVSYGIILVEARHRLQGSDYMLFFGVILYLPADWVYRHAALLEGFSGDLRIMGLLMLVLAFLQSNYDNLRFGALTGENAGAPPQGMKRANRRLAAAFIVPIVLISMWPALQDTLSAAANALKQLLKDLFHFLESLMPDQEPPPEVPPTEPAEPMVMPEGDPFVLWVWLEKAAYIIVGTVLFLLLAYGLFHAARQLFPSLRRLLAWLTASRAELRMEQGYVDEVNAIRKPVIRGGWRRLFGREKEARIRYEELGTNRERVRFLFARAVRQAEEGGWRRSDSRTPEELARESEGGQGPGWLNRATARLYGEARYGTKEPSDEETLLLKERLDAGAVRKR